MSIEIIPTGAAIGAEIRGVDLARPIDDETFAAIERAYNDHAVIFFRDQQITPPQQVAFTRRFGEIEFNIFGERWSVPGSPEIVVVSNVTGDGRPIGVRRAGENWHSDMSYASAARDDALRIGDSRAVWFGPGRHRIRRHCRGVGCLAGAHAAAPPRAPRGV